MVRLMLAGLVVVAAGASTPLAAAPDAPLAAAVQRLDRGAIRQLIENVRT